MAGEGQESEGVPGPDDHEHGHQGSFGTGQETTEHHPEREEEEGDFATGDERRGTPTRAASPRAKRGASTIRRTGQQGRLCRRRGGGAFASGLDRGLPGWSSDRRRLTRYAHSNGNAEPVAEFSRGRTSSSSGRLDGRRRRARRRAGAASQPSWWSAVISPTGPPVDFTGCSIQGAATRSRTRRPLANCIAENRILRVTAADASRTRAGSSCPPRGMTRSTGPVPRRLPSDRRSRRGDPGCRGAPTRAPRQPRHPARVLVPRCRARPLEAGLGAAPGRRRNMGRASFPITAFSTSRSMASAWSAAHVRSERGGEEFPHSCHGCHQRSGRVGWSDRRACPLHGQRSRRDGPDDRR